MMTVNALSLYSITEMMDIILGLKERYGSNRVYWSVNLIKRPVFMEPLALPASLRNERLVWISEWFSGKKDNPLISEMEKESVARLIEYLGSAATPDPLLWDDFHRFYSQYDRRRGKDIHRTFPPQLVDWYRSLEQESI